MAEKTVGIRQLKAQLSEYINERGNAVRPDNPGLRVSRRTRGKPGWIRSGGLEWQETEGRKAGCENQTGK